MKPAGYSRVVWVRRLNDLAADRLAANPSTAAAVREAHDDVQPDGPAADALEAAHELDMDDLPCDGQYRVLQP